MVDVREDLLMSPHQANTTTDTSEEAVAGGEEMHSALVPIVDRVVRDAVMGTDHHKDDTSGSVAPRSVYPGYVLP